MIARSAPSSRTSPSGATRTVKITAGRGPSGQQAGGALAQHRRIEPGLAVGQIERGAAPPGLGVDRVAVVDEPGDVGDRVMEQQIAPAASMAKAWSRSVELAGSRVTKGRAVRSAWASGAPRRGSAAASTSGGKPAGTWNCARIAARPLAEDRVGIAKRLQRDGRSVLAMAQRQIILALHLDQARGGALELEGAVAGRRRGRCGSASAAASSFTLCS